ncbi:type II toxin-antitoxin system VapC family toxin [Micromonospora sp. PTRAS2]|uniref:type II toxin-antitoxin system VapC family toxin n=1 Tax=unclassified Micromonospora TaxID=2617518 RepID=UPI00098D3D7C|nr:MULTISPECIES: type II toxin-antitoxin system VapC family toxin [unclassified Micromonospora]MDI5936680.1 type II toxin-antitoxin system VapC family toxin [Micromonospora sp. DH15]OON33282.1 PIN domain-containing protein [Micromonospora sp. Rc5]
MIYLDSSALITLLSGRTYATELQEFLESRAGVPMATSSVGFVETVRTLDRIGDYPDAMQMLARNFTEILLTEEVRDLAAALPTGIRTLDALHVASAQVLGDALDVLVTYDKRMADIAASVGVPVAAPGTDQPAT